MMMTQLPTDDSPPEPNEALRAFLFAKEVARIPRWISPDDPLPEIADFLKPKSDVPPHAETTR